MSTNDVPGANPKNRDVLAMGCWAEHEDGSLIRVDSVEAGTVVYSIYDVSVDPPVEYRDAMSEAAFRTQFSWDPNADPDDLASVKWTWRDKTPFDWARVMAGYPAGARQASAVATLTSAQRIARSLDLRAEAVVERHEGRPTLQRAASDIMRGIRSTIDALKPGPLR